MQPWLVPVLFAALSLTASAQSTDPNWDFRSHVNGVVNAILVHEGSVYVGGRFDSIAGLALTNFAKWDGTNWTAPGGGIPTEVYSLAAIGKLIYAAADTFPDPG